MATGNDDTKFRQGGTSMLLDGKVAMIFGGGGAIGGAVARAFAREGAQVYLSGRNGATVEAVANDIRAEGGFAESTTVDALDETEIERYVTDVAGKSGGIDVMLNAIGFPAVQGVPLTDLAKNDFAYPIATWTTSQFLTARAVARSMVKSRSGVILTLSASPARLAVAMTGGFGVACAAVEGLSRTLAAELGPEGVRVVCLRPHRIGETLKEADFPVPRDEFIDFLEGMTLTKKLPTLADVANTAVFLASDGAAAISGTVANLTGGMSVD
jgi:NAD(P)-dependent dehydrogenase (short-subunit alcohol dehydrogenase family)